MLTTILNFGGAGTGLRAGNSASIFFDEEDDDLDVGLDDEGLAASLTDADDGREVDEEDEDGGFVAADFAVDLDGFGGVGVVCTLSTGGVEDGLDGGLVGGVDLVGGGIGDGAVLVGFDLGMGVTKGADVGVGIGDVAGGFKDE